jgi:DNA mismatch repair protein MutS
MDISSMSGLTPLMQQYFDLRHQFDDAVLLFQVGDFYELFFDDAQQVSSFFGIALTKRGTFQGQPIPLCGFPVHVLDHYVTKLVKGGYKVALCQQLEQAVAGKMVSRGVTQVFTPGTLTSETLLLKK